MKLAVLAPAALALLFVPTSARAHSTLEHSEPKAGAVLKVAPNELRIWFTEPIKVSLSTIEVRDEKGHQVDQKDLHADQKERSLVRLTLLKNLGPGKYKVSWTAVAQDMHASKGAFEFRISATATD